MIARLPALGLVGGAAAFGATCAVLALIGLGVPFLLATLAASVCAGLLIYGVGTMLAPTPASEPAPDRTVPPELTCAPDLEDRIHKLEENSSDLRHDLRGVLSPALMMADRLLKNEDPAVRRAGQAVVRSVERATTLLAENKRATLSATGRDAQDDEETAGQSHAGGSAGPAG